MYRFLQDFLHIIICILRLAASGISTMFNRLGATRAPLLMIPTVYSPHFFEESMESSPSLLVLSSFLPETRNQPLPNTIRGVGKGWVNPLASPREAAYSSSVIRKARDHLDPSVLHGGSTWAIFSHVHVLWLSTTFTLAQDGVKLLLRLSKSYRPPSASGFSWKRPKLVVLWLMHTFCLSSLRNTDSWDVFIHLLRIYALLSFPIVLSPVSPISVW